MPREGGGRWSWLPRAALAAGLLLGVASFYALGLADYVSWDYLRGRLDLLKARVDEHFALALLVFVLTYVAATALSLPVAAALSLTAGALFGPWWGTAAALASATAGATLAFLASRYLFRDWVVRRLGARAEALDRGVEKDGAYYLLTLRLVPAFPFFLVNLGMGLTRLPTWTFAWVSLVGMLPGAFVYVYAGVTAESLASPRDVLSPRMLLALALLGVVPLGLRLLVRRLGKGPPADQEGEA
jgi:uncharacterized membrane protein YdjX (TVP38/TMEM64 family)